MNLDALHTLADTLQSFAIGLGVLSGGVWTLYTFRSFHTSLRSRAELLKIERELKEQAVVTVDVDAAQAALPDDPRRFIQVSARLENHGNRNLRLDFGHDVLRVARVDTDEAQGLAATSVICSPAKAVDADSGTLYDLEYTVVRAGQRRSHPFWVCVPDPGLYLIEFRALLTGQDLRRPRTRPASKFPASRSPDGRSSS